MPNPFETNFSQKEEKTSSEFPQKEALRLEKNLKKLFQEKNVPGKSPSEILEIERRITETLRQISELSEKRSTPFLELFDKKGVEIGLRILQATPLYDKKRGQWNWNMDEKQQLIGSFHPSDPTSSVF